MGRHLLIVNTFAGGGRAPARVRALVDGLRLDGETFETAFTDAPGHAHCLAEQAASDYETLVVVGGDGTVSEVASGLLENPARRAVLAILPMGTGNDTGHGLGIHGWDDGVASLSSQVLRHVDVCEITFTTPDGPRRRLSLVGSGIGFPAEVTARATRRVKRILRHQAYLYGAFATLFYRSPEMRITVDGEVITGRYRACVVANMERTAGQKMVMAPGAICDDGWLNVSLLADSPLLRLFVCLKHITTGDPNFPEYTGLKAREVEVESDPPARMNLDGDLAGTTPVRFRILPGALPVRMPRET